MLKFFRRLFGRGESAAGGVYPETPWEHTPPGIDFHPSFVEVAAKLNQEQKRLIAEIVRERGPRSLVPPHTMEPRPNRRKVKSVSSPRRRKSKVKSVSRRRTPA